MCISIRVDPPTALSPLILRKPRGCQWTVWLEETRDTMGTRFPSAAVPPEYVRRAAARTRRPAANR